MDHKFRSRLIRCFPLGTWFDRRCHSGCAQGYVPQTILEMGPGILAVWQLLADEETGGRLQLTPSVILSISLAGNGSASAQRASAPSRRQFQEIPLDVRSRTRLR
jgi:hypothetical protein